MAYCANPKLPVHQINISILYLHLYILTETDLIKGLQECNVQPRTIVFIHQGIGV